MCTCTKCRGKGEAIAGKLYTMLANRHLDASTILKFVIAPPLEYAVEFWPGNTTLDKKLEAAHVAISQAKRRDTDKKCDMQMGQARRKVSRPSDGRQVWKRFRHLRKENAWYRNPGCIYDGDYRLWHR